MIISKLTSKSQTTIPQAVRIALGLKEGDELVYVLDGNRVLLERRAPESKDDPFATFSEWDGDADRRAYGGL